MVEVKTYMTKTMHDLIVTHHRIKEGHTPRDRDQNLSGTVLPGSYSTVAHQQKQQQEPIAAFLPAAVMNNNLPERNDEGPDFERLLRQIDNDDHRFNGHVGLGRLNNSCCILSDRGAQRLGQCLLQATARGRVQFRTIYICPYYMTANAFGYSALLDFLETGQYRNVSLDQENNRPSRHAAPEQPPGMAAAAMEHILTAMIANQQPDPASLTISGLSLTIPVLHLALQCQDVSLTNSPLLQQQQQLPVVVPARNDITHHDDHPAAAVAAAAALRNSPERGTDLCLFSDNDDWFEMLRAATTLPTSNVVKLNLVFSHTMIVGRLENFSILTDFLTSQPNSVSLSLTFRSASRRPASQIDTDAIVEHIMADVLTQCPDVHSLFIHLPDRDSGARSRPLLFHERFVRLTELLSNTALKRLLIIPSTVLSPDQLEQIGVIAQRNGDIPVYLGTTGLLKPAVDDLFHPWFTLHDAYDDDGKALPKHLFVLSHALRQAAVHPIFFSHFYEFVRNNADGSGTTAAVKGFDEDDDDDDFDFENFDFGDFDEDEDDFDWGSMH
jgi:hypothetical protein